MARKMILVVAAATFGFIGLRYYLIIKPVEYPMNFDPSWHSGNVLHILPTVNHERLLLKVSFLKALQEPPILSVGRTIKAKGIKTDTEGRFWMFDVSGLEPDTEYELLLQDASGDRLCDPWQLRTFPHPDATPKRVRLLIYTGLGGHDVHREWMKTGPQPLAIRQRLLNRALSFKPDVVISSGDQIYYDLTYDKSAKIMGDSPRSKYHIGVFDRTKRVLGTTNEQVLKRAADPQIAFLYGTVCRSIPTFFLLDDHDYFENDVAMENDGFDIRLLLLGWRSPFFKGGVSFPPDNFMLELARTVQKLYLPEFLPDRGRPMNLPDTGAEDRAQGVSECYGTVRYGKLVEALLYESRRFTTLTGDDAVMIHPAAEKWLIDRMRAEETRHVLNVPATVFGWSAGKWMEWYPDVRGRDGRLTKSIPKYKWQPGWFAQHNRILKAASQMKRSVPLFICGDLHNQSAGWIDRSGDLDLSKNPVLSVCSGSLGTGPRMWPSAFRGLVAEPPTDIVMRQVLKPVEKNGFVIVDITEEKIQISFYAWREPEPVEAIDTLKPHHVMELKTRRQGEERDS